MTRISLDAIVAKVDELPSLPQLTAIVRISDAVTMQMGKGLGIDGLLYPLSTEAMDLLGIGSDDLEILMAEIVDLFIDKDVF